MVSRWASSSPSSRSSQSAAPTATFAMVAWPHRGALWAEITPVEPDPVSTGEGRKNARQTICIAAAGGLRPPKASPADRIATNKEGVHGGTMGSPVLTGEGSALVPRCLTIAGSDAGGGAGIQADLKAFAAAGCHGMSAIVALTAQNTTGVTAVHEAPADFVRAELEAVFDDIGVDAAKTGMLFSRRLIETVADFLDGRGVPLVVDPVMVASSGARLLQDDAVETLVSRLFPLATVVTP